MSIIKRKKDNPLYSLKDQVDSIFNSFFNDFPFDLRRSSQMDTFFAPRVNFSETPLEYQVEAELPGISKEDLTLDLTDDVLTISAERKEKKTEKNKDYHMVESYYGTVQRKIRLPRNVNQDKIDAEFKDGLLTIKLPKLEEAKRMSNIKIKS